MQKKLTSFLFILVFFFGVAIDTHAQSDTVVSIIKILHSLQPPSRFDSSLFVQQANRINDPNLVLSDTDIAALHTVATGYNKGTDFDLNLYLRCRIMSNLSRAEFYRAIDYAKQNMPKFDSNRGPQSILLRQSFLLLLRVPYWSSDRIREGFVFYNNLLNKSKLNGDNFTTVTAYYSLSRFYRTVGLIDVAIYHAKKGLTIIDTTDHNLESYFTLVGIYKGFNAASSFAGILGELYSMNGEYETSLVYSRATLAMQKRTVPAVKGLAVYNLKNMAMASLQLNRLDSAAFYLDAADKIVSYTDKSRWVTMLQVRSLVYLEKGNFVAADSVIAKCWELINSGKMNSVSSAGIANPDYYQALIRIKQGKFTDAAILLKRDLVRVQGVRIDMLRDYKLLGETYEKIGDQQRARESFVSYIKLQDSLLSDQSRFRSLSFEMEEQLAEKGKAIDQLQTDKKISSILWMFSLGIVLLLIILSILINQRYRVKRKANAALEKTLAELKNTQSQLVQSEKMASLGELTAGIAHEIQNPLNFVNNFSEVNKELLLELKDEIKKGNYEDVSSIANDVINNEEKINHHGKRADAIVKGMLQHSRSTSGAKEPTDINALADEYFRLAYHGLRAKDKSFNATMITEYDGSVGMVNVIPQDIGRVILNLITNAFYVVDEKKKQTGEGFEPTVSVSTKNDGDKILISVKDNGNGIPAKILDKIFQPFFTTKPTGQGTGLGLSLSYDILKAHGGELKVETKEGVGTEFIIQLSN